MKRGERREERGEKKESKKWGEEGYGKTRTPAHPEGKR
jgi:hypothetical protein